MWNSLACQPTKVPSSCIDHKFSASQGFTVYLKPLGGYDVKTAINQQCTVPTLSQVTMT